MNSIWSQKAKRLLLALAGYRDAGIDDPTVPELERYSHQSPATVLSGLQLLQEQGYISVVHDDQRDRYTLNACTLHTMDGVVMVHSDRFVALQLVGVAITKPDKACYDFSCQCGRCDSTVRLHDFLVLITDHCPILIGPAFTDLALLNYQPASKPLSYTSSPQDLIACMCLDDSDIEGVTDGPISG